ncbi:hypothetical protein JVU11DRAFT_22 [Chiua virens]|nr:hypothetical protein JVU11DRAFT_22 [Chiua virens]
MIYFIIENLRQLTRRELQAVAVRESVRANQKSATIINRLIKKYPDGVPMPEYNDGHSSAITLSALDQLDEFHQDKGKLKAKAKAPSPSPSVLPPNIPELLYPVALTPQDPGRSDSSPAAIAAKGVMRNDADQDQQAADVQESLANMPLAIDSSTKMGIGVASEVQAHDVVEHRKMAPTNGKSARGNRRVVSAKVENTNDAHADEEGVPEAAPAKKRGENVKMKGGGKRRRTVGNDADEADTGAKRPKKRVRS